MVHGLENCQAALPEQAFDALVGDLELRLWATEQPFNLFDETSISGEADTVTPSHQTKRADSAKKGTFAPVLAQVSTHQRGQYWHLFCKRQVHDFFRQFDHVPSRTSRREKRDAGWNTRLAFYVNVRLKGFVGGYAND
jgi:hypothetical protein